MFAIACLAFGGADVFSNLTLPSLGWLSLGGVVHFVIGRYSNYRATQTLGANLSAPVQQLSIPIALTLALIFLDEVLTPLRLAGLLLVMVGPLIALRKSRDKNTKSGEHEFRPRYLEGVMWGVLCAIGYGISPIFIVKGLGLGGGLIAGLVGGFVSYLAAAIVIVTIVMLTSGLFFLRQLDRTAGRWFVLSGVLVFLSQMCRFMALAVAPVSIVVPIQRLSVVFRVIFGWILNREHEVFTARVLLGILMSLIGAVALTLSSDIVASLLPAEWAVRLTIKWP